MSSDIGDTHSKCIRRPERIIDLIDISTIIVIISRHPIRMNIPEIQNRLFEFLRRPFITESTVFDVLGLERDFKPDDFSMSLKVEFCKTADVAHAIDVDGKFSKEIHHSVTAVWQRKPEDKRCRDDAQNFLQKDHDLQCVKSAEFCFHLR